MESNNYIPSAKIKARGPARVRRKPKGREERNGRFSPSDARRLKHNHELYERLEDRVGSFDSSRHFEFRLVATFREYFAAFAGYVTLTLGSRELRKYRYYATPVARISALWRKRERAREGANVSLLLRSFSRVGPDTRAA